MIQKLNTNWVKIPSINHHYFWLSIILIFKLIVFIFFNSQFQLYVDGVEGWIATTADTNEYYEPIKEWVNGNGLSSACRMPGLLPILGPLYFLFSDLWVNNSVVILQFLTSCISTFLLAKICYQYFPKVPTILIVIIILSTPFLSIYQHYASSDSFSTSFMIIGAYFFSRYRLSKPTNQKVKFILLSAIFLIWSTYLRQFNLWIFGVFGLQLLINWIKGNKSSFYYGLIYLSAAVLLILPWTLNNFKNGNKVLLVAPISECFVEYPKYQTELRKLPIAWGGKFMVWGKEAEWFLRKTMNENEFPFSNKIMTETYNLDSLKLLRNASLKLFYESQNMNSNEKYRLERYIIDRSTKYRVDYIKENPLDYYLTNKFLLFKKFLFSKEVVLPFPALSEMKNIHFVIKLLAILTTTSILVIGLCTSLIFFKKLPFLNIIIWGYIFIIVGFLGLVEYRYWATIFPFIIIFAAKGIYLFYLKTVKS